MPNMVKNSFFTHVVSELAYLMQDRSGGTRRECVEKVLDEIKKGNQASAQILKDFEKVLQDYEKDQKDEKDQKP